MILHKHKQCDNVPIESIDLPSFFYLRLLCQLRLYPCADKEHALIKHIFAEGTWNENWHGIKFTTFLGKVLEINLYQAFGKACLDEIKK